MNPTTLIDPVPALEQTDPELGALIRWWVHEGRHDWAEIYPQIIRRGEGFIDRVFNQFISAIGRNDPCWCGSGKKFKRCCL